MQWLYLFITLTLPALGFEITENFSELGVDSIFVQSPSNDPHQYSIEKKQIENITLSPLYWLVPGPLAAIPEIQTQNSNNNAAIEFFDKKLFVAFRTGPTHFASKKTKLYIVSTSDGINWNKEWEYQGGKDAREPQLVSYKGKLHFYFFSAGTNPLGFEPAEVLKIERINDNQWTEPQKILTQGEVPWEIKVIDGKIWMSSYSGTHYRVGGGEGKVNLHLKYSEDGVEYKDLDSSKVNLYTGGSSELGFEFDAEGNLWGIGRNEDGDKSGFGSHFIYSPHDQLSFWNIASSPETYQSPRMFRHNEEIYLIARRNLGNKSFDWVKKGGFGVRRILNWLRFSLTPKTTALFKIDKEQMKLVHLLDLPGAGDTAFPSIKRVNQNTFLISNYTSPLSKRKRKWIHGQLGKTNIYLMSLTFN